MQKNIKFTVMPYILTAQGLINCSASQSNYKTIAAALLFSDSCAPKADVIRGVMLIFLKISSKLLTLISACGLLYNQFFSLVFFKGYFYMVQFSGHHYFISDKNIN